MASEPRIALELMVVTAVAAEAYREDEGLAAVLA